MVDKIKQWFRVKDANSELSKALAKAIEEKVEREKAWDDEKIELQSQVIAHKELLKKARDTSNPEGYIKNLMKRDIEWFDHGKLDQGRKVQYHADAQNVLHNEAFRNELDHYIADLVKFCATMDKIPIADKLIVLTNVQTGILVLETFKKRFSDIENPAKITETLDPFDPI